MISIQCHHEEKLMNCHVVIDKPLGWSSHDTVDYIRKLTDVKKVGHAGTLDPKASGVLIVGVGRQATRRLEQFTQMAKRYEAICDLKAFSETDDAEGPLYPVNVHQVPDEEAVDEALQSFVGEQEQVPPAYSSIKVHGVPRYKAARAGHHMIDLPRRSVIIYTIRLLWYKWPYVAIDISCSKGTYIRSIARDLGYRLHTGGYIYELTRTAVGPYTLEDAYDIRHIKHISSDMCIE